MKNHTSLQNKTYLKIYFLYHLIVATIFGVMFVLNHGQLKIDADLFNMLPKSITSKAFEVADTKFNEISAQNAFILVVNSDFEEAKVAAQKVYENLNGSDRFKSVSFYQDTSSFGEIMQFIQKNRYNLLDDKTIEQLNVEGGVENIAQNALSQIYGAFTITSLENLDTDPFMLGELNMQSYISYLQNAGTSMSIKDGVMATFANNQWYVMIRCTLSQKGAALASKTNAVVQIKEICKELEDENTRFIFSGTPFHSYKSSSNAVREISLISSFSMLIVLVILLMIFKRPHPIFCSIGSILISTLTAVMATLGIFGKMHVLTLVFGTSLIGSCIDYSLHYFINWKANTNFSNGMQLRNHLKKGLGLSLISTVLCYFILVFAPFNLLKQMAVFSMSGIISTFLSVICIYPFVPVPSENKEILLIKILKIPSWYNKKFVGRIVVSLMFAFSIVTLIVCHKNFKIENNVQSLYKMEGKEFQDEEEASRILNYNPSGWFIASGDSVEETLKTEEKITRELNRINAGKEKGGYVCTSAFIPSIAHQKQSRYAAEKLLQLAEEQYEFLGYEVELADDLRKDFYASQNDFVEMGKNIPEFLEESVKSAWLGEIEGKYYSVVIPVSITDYGAYKKIANDVENVQFVSKVRGINEDLDRLSKMILILFMIVYIVIFIVLKFFYNLKQTLKIVSVPLLIILFEAAIFSLAKINLEFFSITGMILVFGLGLDYVIYMIENEKRKDTTPNADIELFAIALSFVTTAVSFGALALSSFIPVHNIGLSIFIGLSVAYATTFFYTRG